MELCTCGGLIVRCRETMHHFVSDGVFFCSVWCVLFCRCAQVCAEHHWNYADIFGSLEYVGGERWEHRLTLPKSTWNSDIIRKFTPAEQNSQIISCTQLTRFSAVLDIFDHWLHSLAMNILDICFACPSDSPFHLPDCMIKFGNVMSILLYDWLVRKLFMKGSSSWSQIVISLI